MVPKIYETGTIEYEGTETLYIIEQKVKRNRINGRCLKVGKQIFFRGSSDIFGTGVRVYCLYRE